MTDWISNLEPILRSFWLIAISSSVIFIIQTVLTFIGTDSSDGLAADFESGLEGGDAPFQLFSFRNLLNFLLGFSWAGISFYDSLDNKAIVIALAVLVGLIFVYLFFLIIRQLSKLAENNSFRLSETLNKQAKVYLSIPANKSGTGKIIVSVKGSVKELEAITENDKIETGELVIIVGIENNLLVVKNLKS